MTNISAECQKWIACLKSLDLDSVVQGLQNFKFKKNHEEHNKYLFKVLLHLAHSADKCKKQKLSKEIEIYKIANTVCENLSNVPDNEKFYSALYFSIQYILEKQLFKEAKIVSSFLFPGKILGDNDRYPTKECYQIASLWQAELYKKLDSLINAKSRKEGLDEEFCSNLKFLLRILNYCEEKYCYTFKVAEAMVKKLGALPLLTTFPCLLIIFQHLADYFVELKQYPLVNAYHYIILMIGQAFFKRNDSINNANILGYFRQCDALLGESFKTSSESYNCYKFFREYAINLFETNHMSKEIGGPRLKKCLDLFEAVLERYGKKENKSLTETLMAVAYSFEALFNSWEGPVAKQLENTSVTYDDVACIGEFVKKVYTVIKNRQLPPNYKCPKCSDPDSCKNKKDMYNASLATSTFLRVINKCNPASITDKMFFLAKDLLDEMVLVFNEFQKLNCKYARSMWILVGRIIFNFGLITEAKYPAELEKLYELLCRQIINFDGLDSKTSSFGLENPVSTALTRLCNSNFNRENYRKAMSYTAYNALLSNVESRQKKAYDMWGVIKQKTIDFVDMQELTLIKCLETDAEIVKRVGITVNIKQYDLADVCLRELKALSQVQSNLMMSMKKTIEKLESIGNSLHYGQGVLLLCCHALQFEKREIISDYISKAIEKLKSSKAKSYSTHCLLANLNFFRILEKLFVRKRAIAEQIEDATFTVKAFKTMKGSQENEDLEDKDEIVPTYGGINIEEDNRCANELREVLTMWESCFKTDLDSIAKDWEPKITLEIVTICGEYCRLYKFNSIEEKSWKLAYKLAAALEDYTTCIYVTSRSLSLRCINDTWISEAEAHVDNLKRSTKVADTNVVALFWLSLADFYLDCKKVKEAKALLDMVKSLPCFDLLSNTKMYIYYVDILFRNFHTVNEATSQEDYANKLVQIHYLLINLHDWVSQDTCRFWNVRYVLFSCEQMFEVMSNIVVPMVGLLSFREIVSHMTVGLKIAQKFGMTLRIAQYLKYFCYVDLLRLHAENCETRLQDLEHILCLENFQKSMNTKAVQKLNSQLSKLKIDPKTTNAVTVREAVHDPVSLSRNNASPELKKKLFTLPDFMRHSSLCQCFTCTSPYYQQLTFSCTHIRAQLYSILKYTKEAEHYFYGASKIKLNIDDRYSDTLREYKSYKWGRHQNDVVDYISYLLDFAVHIVDFKPRQKDDALALIEEALDVAAQNGLDKHCVAVYATELYYQHYIYNLPQDKLFAAIYVPTDIPITITNQPSTGCITPKQQVEKAVRNPRRRKTPPAIPVVSIIDSSDEENNCGNSPVPKAPTVKETKPTRTRVRNVRRKILVDEVEEKEEPQKLTRTRSSSRSKEKDKEEEQKPMRSKSLRLKSSTGRL